MTARQEIRAAQLADVENVERQLREGEPYINVNGQNISREAAWAATQAIRSCWRRGLRYDGQWRDAEGAWWAQGEHAESGALEPEYLGKFPA